MKKIISIFIFSLFVNITIAQNKQEAEKLIDEGITMHDKGDFDGAIVKYNKALELDKDNVTAQVEKSLSLLSANRNEEAITLCKKIIDKFPDDIGLNAVFVTYGNALDGLKKPEESIVVYNEGIKRFPSNYQLHFNKGISLAGINKNEDALLCFQKAVSLNPKHPGSNNAMARILYSQSKNIPSLLAFCRFLVLEPQTVRAKENLDMLQKITKANVEQTGKNNITISIDSKMLDDTAKDGKMKENSFSTTQMTLSMSAALDYDKKNEKKTAVEQFIRKFEVVCASLAETKNKNTGFYWDYYAPYFIELNRKNLIEPFAYIVFAASDKDDVSKWLKSHEADINKFYEWSSNYSWRKK